MEVRTFQGPEVTPYLPDVARLRIEVFREYPYLYDGNATYEAEYLSIYAKSPRSVFVIALDEGRVVGASTGMPLAEESAAFQKPFTEHGIALDDVFYFGESVLEKSQRGRGIGHRFFDAREAHANAHGFSLTAFCAVERETNDPRRPAGQRDNDAFWLKRGYQKQPDMRCSLSWKQIDEAAESPKSLCFWLRRFDGQPPR